LNISCEAGRHERRVRRRGDVRDLLQQLDVLPAAVELVVAEQARDGVAAEDAVLLLVDLLEQGALVELGARCRSRSSSFFVTLSTLILSCSPVSLCESRYLSPRHDASSF
jgi:hypothetical protein